MRSIGPRTALLSSVLLGCCPAAFSLDPALDVSQYAHNAWKVSEGFTLGRINTIVQTPDGYLWLGTEFGLFRFDGVRAVAWQPPVGEHLPSSLVRKLLASADGTLWIGTDRGLASLKEGHVRAYPGVPAQRIDALLEDQEKTLWIGVESVPSWQLCAMRIGKTECYGRDGSLGLGVGTLFEDTSGNLWVGTGSGLWQWKAGVAKRILLPGLASEVHAITEGSDRALLIATRAGLMRLVDGKVAPYRLAGTGSQFNPYWLLVDRHGSVWIGTIDRGIFHQHQRRTDQFTQPDGLSSDTTGDLFEDREGNIWICTNDGLDRFRDYAITTVPVKQGLAASYVESVLASRDGTVWVGTRNGLDRWEAGRLTLYRRQATQVPDTVRQIIDTGLPDDFQGSLLQDDHGRIWFFSVNGAAYLENDRFISARAMPGGYAHSIVQDAAGVLWISQDQALFRMLPDHVVERIPWIKLGHHGLALALAADPVQGGVWLGFSEGGLAYFKDGQVRASYAAGDHLSDGRVNALQINKDGTLWVATERGLSRVKNGGIINLNKQNGLPCESIHEVMEDESHSLWLYMACGLARIAQPDVEAWIRNPKYTVQVEIFGNSDGLRSGAIPDGLSPRLTTLADKTMWYVSEGQIFLIDPGRRSFSLNKVAPPVHIERVIADGRTYSQNLTGDPSPRLNLPRVLHDLTIDYTALSLVVPEKVRFRFKLEGQDKDWREVVNDRQVQYSNLAPKHYRFLVKACNNSGVWNEEGAALEFVIPPAWYQTNWFRTLCLTAAVGLLWLIYDLRMQGLRQRQQLLERHQAQITALNDRLVKAQEEERTRIAGELHDGVLQQLTSVSLLLGSLKYELSPTPEMKQEISDVQQRLINVGTDIRQISHELHPAALQDRGLPDALFAYCDEFSKTRGIPVSCEADKGVEKLSRGAALCLYRIAQEALGNVAKHSQAKHVQVRLALSNGHVRLSVSDDGIGCAADKTADSRGLGLVNMRERVRQLNGTFKFQSEPGRGSAVAVQVPFRT